MRKEVLIAILIGLSLGLVVVFGIKTARQSLANIPNANSSIKDTSSTQKLLNQSDHTLLITSPEPNEILSESMLAIIGSTTPQSYVSIVSAGDEAATIADENGAFNATLTLSGGLNTITVTSFDSNGTSIDTVFSVIYTTADLSATVSATTKKEPK